MQTAGDHSCSLSLFIQIVVPGSISDKYFAFLLYCVAWIYLLFSILAAISAVGSTSESSKLLTIQSLVQVRLPSSCCVGEDPSYSAGVFQKSSKARYTPGLL